MYKQELIKKEYKLPVNLPSSLKHKYVEIIEKEYAKYIDIIYNCGGYIMLDQMTKLIRKYEGNHRKEESNRKAAYKVLKKLKDLSFVKDGYINRNKYIYLRKAGLALATGDYNTSERLVSIKSISNIKFKISVIKAEYFINKNEIIVNDTLLEEIKKVCFSVIENNSRINLKNKYPGIYSDSLINDIAKSKNISEMLDKLKRYSNQKEKLWCLHQILEGLCKIFNTFSSQKIGLLKENEFFSIGFSVTSKSYLTQYIPNIVLFDVERSYQYLNKKINMLNYDFYKIDKNSSHNLRKKYENNNSLNDEDKKKLPNDLFCDFNRCGYRLNIITNNKKTTLEKVEKFKYEESKNTVRVGKINIIEVDTDKYFLHASRGNKVKLKKDKELSEIIYDDLIRLREKSHIESYNFKKLY